jgi:hypothetical protein
MVLVGLVGLVLLLARLLLVLEAVQEQMLLEQVKH